jgi:hypothetical protein
VDRLPEVFAKPNLERELGDKQIAKDAVASEGRQHMNSTATSYAPFFMPPRAKNGLIWSNLRDADISI